jgi:hypothetical protein
VDRTSARVDAFVRDQHTSNSDFTVTNNSIELHLATATDMTGVMLLSQNAASEDHELGLLQGPILDPAKAKLGASHLEFENLATILVGVFSLAVRTAQ